MERRINLLYKYIPNHHLVRIIDGYTLIDWNSRAQKLLAKLKTSKIHNEKLRKELGKRLENHVPKLAIIISEIYCKLFNKRMPSKYESYRNQNLSPCFNNHVNNNLNGERKFYVSKRHMGKVIYCGKCGDFYYNGDRMYKNRDLYAFGSEYKAGYFKPKATRAFRDMAYYDPIGLKKLGREIHKLF